MESKPYIIYIIIGSCYLISKIIYFSMKYICFGGLVHGFISTLLTFTAAFLAFNEYKKAKGGIVFHWLMVIIPLLIIPLTPAVMMFNLGDKIFELNKIVIFTIWEILASVQVLITFTVYGKVKILNQAHQGAYLNHSIA